MTLPRPRFLPGLTLLLVACGPTQWEPTLLEGPAPTPVAQAAPYLNVHFHSGDVVSLASWITPARDDTELQGFGVRYGPERMPRETRTHVIPFDSIALLESNRQSTTSQFGFSGLVIWTALSTAITAFCVADPKSCFGSCPTFYVEEAGAEGAGTEPENLVAEGFSASFARVLEATDVDALPPVAERDRTYSLVMRNEAPETHAIRWARLLALPRPTGGELFATSEGRFLTATDATAPAVCRTSGRPGQDDCRDEVRSADGNEYFSASDSEDLATRELLELEFPMVQGEGELGLVLKGRASLLSTYLFYQTIAYLGRDAGTWLASLERGNPAVVERALGLAREMGDVEVLLERDGLWTPVGRFGEAGPIAADEQVIPLGPDMYAHTGEGPIRIRLRMAQGAWRIDRAALVRIGAEVEAIVLEPHSVEPLAGTMTADQARARLLDPEEHLVTQRGDAFRLHYELPAPGAELALFLETRGYYYEWMRGEWAPDEDPGMAALVFADPAQALRTLAPAFKAREASMESTFWSSRFRRDVP